ncbi:MAG: hypothetical protein SGJ15_11335 [Bacteroidota bacterium]|nr:hypothetical protein [Bacteroidota bacterium]
MSNAVTYSQTNYSSVIDKSTSSAEYKSLINSIDESPISSDPMQNGWKYLSFYKTGIEILIIKDKVHTIFFHYKKNSKFSAFNGQLPKNLSWGMSKADVHIKAGSPTKSGGGGEFLGEPVMYWDKYSYSNYALHITYMSNTVYEVSLMSLIKP